MCHVSKSGSGPRMWLLQNRGPFRFLPVKLFKYLCTIRHVKVRTWCDFDKYRRSNARPQPTAGVTACSVTLSASSVQRNLQFIKLIIDDEVELLLFQLCCFYFSSTAAQPPVRSNLTQWTSHSRDKICGESPTTFQNSGASVLQVWYWVKWKQKKEKYLKRSDSKGFRYADSELDSDFDLMIPNKPKMHRTWTHPFSWLMPRKTWCFELQN